MAGMQATTPWDTVTTDDTEDTGVASTDARGGLQDDAADASAVVAAVAAAITVAFKFVKHFQIARHNLLLYI